MQLLPWRGSGFGEPNDHGLPPRLLLVGESHYGGGDPHDCFTTEVVKDYYIDRGNLPFFSKLAKVILGPDWSQYTRENRASFYNSVAFYNFIQHVLGEIQDRPTSEMWEFGRKAFLQCLDFLQPSHIVVFGFGVWDELPHERFSPDSQLEANIAHHLPERYRDSQSHEYRGWVGRYQHSGREALAMKVIHASRCSPAAWHSVAQWFVHLSK